MVPLEGEAADRVLAWEADAPRSISLRHALIHRREGLWGDHPRSPRSVLLVREADAPEGCHAFGAGAAEPAVGWLARRGRPFSLLAPEGWEGALRRRSPSVLRGIVETWARSGGAREAPRAATGIAARRLTRSDGPAFAATSPAWALLGWGEFARLIEHGAAVGVPDRDGRLAAVAWIFESDDGRDSLAVATDARYRRLGLGRAAAAALLAHVEDGRRKAPLWTVDAANVPSRALARSLGFAVRARETVLRWSP